MSNAETEQVQETPKLTKKEAKRLFAEAEAAYTEIARVEAESQKLIAKQRAVASEALQQIHAVHGTGPYNRPNGQFTIAARRPKGSPEDTPAVFMLRKVGGDAIDL